VSPVTVLVVDDEPLVRQLVQTALEHDGYAVLAAASGDEAVAMEQEHPGRIDLVLTDVTMPGLRGHELVPLLAARRPGLHALYMSGYADVSPAHVSPLLQKPFGLSELRDAVRATLASVRAA
jgi:CheY-like chemotaxis protein